MSAVRFAKRLLNRSADIFFQIPAFDAFWFSRSKGSAICLCYHRVDDPERHSFLTRGGVPAIKPADLERDLRFIQEMGARFITFDGLRSGWDLRSSEVSYIVTFDDCYRDNYTHGLDVLTRLGIPAVFFQTTGMVDSEELILEHALFWFVRDPMCAQAFTRVCRDVLADEPGVVERAGLELVRFLIEHVEVAKLEHLVEKMKASGEDLAGMREAARDLYPSRKQVLKAANAGHEVASHGRRHLNRRNIDDALFEEELRVSSVDLAGLTGHPPRSFAYPYGAHRVGDDKICARYYSHAVTTDFSRITSRSRPLALGRSYWPGPLKKSWHRRWLLTGRF